MGALFHHLGDLDRLGFQFLNSFSGRSPLVDFIIDRFDSDGLKGCALMITFGALWFQRDDNAARRRETLILTLVSIAVALVVARLLADLLPLRQRPMYVATIGYRKPLVEVGTSLENWSSFPSDNATLVFAVTTGVWLVSRVWGILWAVFATATMIARVCVGIHYPGDVIAGALIGIAIALAVIRSAFMQKRVAAPIMLAEHRVPAIFYSVLLITLFEVGTLFDFVRESVHEAGHVALMMLRQGM